MDKLEIMRRAAFVIRGARHHWYSRTVEKSNLWTTLSTGEGMEKLLKQYARRESAEAFAQRVKITQHITPSVVSRCVAAYYKVPRANYVRLLQYDNNDDKRRQELEGLLGRFNGSQGLEDYLATRLIEMNETDPNAFVVVEFGAFDPARQLAQPYPFEVSSEGAIDYLYQNNVLEYLIAKSKISADSVDPEATMYDRYTVYMKDQTVIIQQIPDKVLPPVGLMELEYSNPGPVGVYYLKVNNVFYSVTEAIPHNAGQVPAIRAGYSRDGYTASKTPQQPMMKSIFADAVGHLLKSVKVNSEHDLTMALSAYPMTLRYAEPCQARGCIHGYTDSGEPCGSCHGSGEKQRPTSAQEELTLEMPRNPADMVNLNDILVYKAPPVELLAWIDGYIDKLAAQCVQIIFNTDIFSRQEIASTATGKNIDLQNVYDTLYPFAQQFARVWADIVTISAKFADRDKGLTAKIRFSKDFKLKGMNDLIGDLEAARRANAGPGITSQIESEIMGLMLAEDPQALTMQRVKDRFNPFAGMPVEMVMTFVNSDLVPYEKKILYANMGDIFDRLALENPMFYDFAASKQKELIDAEVSKIIESITNRQAPEFSGN